MIWALPGFLGEGRDWEYFREPLARKGFSELSTVDLFSLPPWGQDLPSWGQKLAAQISAVDPSPVLLAYSFGGRLALHALLAAPALFRAAILVSTHWGLSQEDERRSRLDSDELWAERFVKGDWNKLMSDWNSQSVLASSGSQDPSLTMAPFYERREENFHRGALAWTLRGCSLGRQANLLLRVKEISCPVLALAGSEDSKFAAELGKVQGLTSNIQTRLLKGVGHRLPWESPELFLQELGSWQTTFR